MGAWLHCFRWLCNDENGKTIISVTYKVYCQITESEVLGYAFFSPVWLNFMNVTEALRGAAGGLKPTCCADAMKHDRSEPSPGKVFVGVGNSMSQCLVNFICTS